MVKTATLITGLVFAFTIENALPAYAFGPQTQVVSLEDALEKLIPEAPKGATSWRTLGKAEVVENKKTGTISPKFPAAIKKLDGKEIDIVGFLFPIETGEKQEHFLLSALPPSCPFCLPAGPNYLMDVKAAKGIDFSYDPVHLKGKLQLLDASDAYQMFYRLNHATVVR